MNIPVINNYSKSTARILAAAKDVYDRKFKNNGEATLGGIFILIIPILFGVLCYYNPSLMNDQKSYLIIMIAGALLIRLTVVKWVSHLTEDLNRKSAKWIILSIFIPGITLIIIGGKKKIKDPNENKKYLWKPKLKEILLPVIQRFKSTPDK